jgi:hypothetical protein
MFRPSLARAYDLAVVRFRPEPDRLRPFDEAVVLRLEDERPLLEAVVRLDDELRFFAPPDDCLRPPELDCLRPLDVDRVRAFDVDRFLAPEDELCERLRGVSSSCISTYALKRAMSARTARLT